MALKIRLAAAVPRSVPTTRSSLPTRAARVTAASSKSSAPGTRCLPKDDEKRIELNAERVQHWIARAPSRPTASCASSTRPACQASGPQQPDQGAARQEGQERAAEAKQKAEEAAAAAAEAAAE